MIGRHILVKSKIKWIFFPPIILIIAWLYVLRNTSWLYDAYLIIGIGGIALCFFEAIKKEERVNNLSFKQIAASLLCGITFALISFLGNMSMLNNDDFSFNFILKSLIILIGGFVLGGIYILCLSNKDIRFRIRILNKEKLFFIVVNIILVSILILQLVFIEYPALMNYDAWDQFTQVVTNNLNAHHTIMHTMIIKLCISLSGIFTTDLTVAAFIYGILQCVIGSIVETYSIFVIYKKTKNYIFSIVLTLMYILFPICSEMMVFITKDSAY